MKKSKPVVFGLLGVAILAIVSVFIGCSRGCSDPKTATEEPSKPHRNSPIAQSTIGKSGVDKGVRLGHLDVDVDPECPVFRKDDPDDDEDDTGGNIEDHQEIQRKLMARLATGVVVELIVLVDASGPAGFGETDSENDADGWRMSVPVTHWRKPGGPIDGRFLYLTDTEIVSDARLKEKMARVEKYAVLKLRAQLDPLTADDRTASRVDGLLLAIIDEKVDDPELSAIGRRLQGPITVDDKDWGTMSLNRELECYSGRRNLGVASFELNVDCNKCDRPETVLTEEKLRRLQCLESNLAKIANFVADDLLETYNDEWTSAGKLSKEQFLERIRLDSVTIGSNLITLYLNGGELFDGHSITVHVDYSKLEVWKAQLAG